MGDETEWVTEDEMGASISVEEVLAPLTQPTLEISSDDIPLSNERTHRRRKSRKVDLITNIKLIDGGGRGGADLTPPSPKSFLSTMCYL